jgi:hypothetical protein
MLAPAGTTVCLKDKTDFPAGSDITVGAEADFHVGDPIVFKAEDGGKLDTGLTASPTVFYVLSNTAGKIQVSATKGGAAVVLKGDGGGASADSAGHINVSYSLHDALCGVKEWSLDISRSSIDVTTLPCKVGGASKYAGFKSSLGGFASGEGSMTVLMTKGTSQVNRLLANSLYKNSTAKVKLYLEAGAGVGGAIDDTTSNYIEATVSLQGFSTGVNAEDAVECEITFALLGTPDVLFGVAL